MAQKTPVIERIKLTSIVNGGQSLGQLSDGRKCFVWGGLPGEVVDIRITKKKSSYAEGIVENVIEPSSERVKAKDSAFISTSPWQIMDFEAEKKYKKSLIYDAFRLHHIELPENIDLISDDVEYYYRNKVEFSFFGDLDASTELETLDLAFFRRGSKGKIIVDGTSLAKKEINNLAIEIRDMLRAKNVTARQLKSLMIRCNQRGDCVWQLYCKERLSDIELGELQNLSAQGGELIYSDPRSPASVITKRLSSVGNLSLVDNLLETPFRYTCDSFFQVNIPVYEKTLQCIKSLIHNQPENFPVLDLYAGVGTIGLTAGNDKTTLVEINASAVEEMQQNIKLLNKSATGILAPSEQALNFIEPDQTVIVDPPRAGLHNDVTEKLLEIRPRNIIYLSCNPVTQARDIEKLLEKYKIVDIKGYNFFPKTPHIETMIVLQAH